MAEGWNKITDKADQGRFEGPFPGDWEAMNAKIGAQPTLNTVPKKGAWWWGAGGALLVLLSLGVAFWFYSPEQKVADDRASENVIESIEESPKLRQQQNNGREIVSDQKNTEIQIDERIPIASENVEVKSISKKQVQKTRVYSAPIEAEENSDNKVAEIAPSKVEGQESDLIISDVNFDEAIEEEGVSIAEFSSAEPTEMIVLNENAETENIQSQQAAVNHSELEGVEAITNDEILSESKVEGIAEESSQGEVITEEKDVEAEKEIAAAVVSKEEDDEDEIQPVNLRSHGFRMNSLSLGGKYLTDYSGDFYGTGVGVDIDIQKGNWLFNTGVSYYTFNRNLFANDTYEKENYTDIRTTNWDTTTTIRLDSVWVIDGPFSGHYVNTSDTTTLVDTTVTSRTDTSIARITAREEIRVKLSYVEIPLLIGQRFKFNRLAIDVYGGVALSQITSSNLEGGDISEKFGVAAILQPGFRYYITEKWSVFGRSGLRYSLVSDQFRERKFYSNFHLGLTYHW